MDDQKILYDLFGAMDELSVKLQDKEDWECTTMIEKIKKDLLSFLERYANDA